MAGITPKQARFVAEYLIDGNATRAAVASGYAQASAHVAGSRLLQNEAVQRAIAESSKRVTTKIEVTAERVIQEVAKLAFHDPAKFFDAQGNPLPLSELGEMERAALAGFEVTTHVSRDGKRTVISKIKTADKGQNLERLMRHLGINDKNQKDMGSTLEQLVAKSFEA